MTTGNLALRLRRHGVLPTSQRLEVAAVLLSKPQHLCADQIIARLKDADSGVSKATVYNTLRLFCDAGLVRELNVDADRRVYDSTTHPHHHFYNVDSGQLHDIPEGQVTVLGLPPLPEGTEQESVDVIVRVRNRG